MSRKVVMVSGHPPFDGRIFHKEARSLRNLGYDVAVIGWDFKGEGLSDEIDGVTLDFRKFPLGRDWSIFKKYSFFSKQVRPKLTDIALGYEPDAVHCHDHQTLPVGVSVKKASGCKLVYDSHEDCPKLEYYQNRLNGIMTYLLERRNLRKVDAVITVSDHIAGKFRKMGLPTEVIFNTTRYDTAKVLVGRDKKKIRRELGLPVNKRIIGYIGSMNYRMDFARYVRALPELPEDIIMVFVAGTEDLYERLRGVAGDNGTLDRIVMLPRVPYEDCLKYTYSFDLGLQAIMSDPLAEHTLPTKIFEYMALKVPYVGPDLVDLAAFTRKWNSGFIFSDRSPRGIAKTVKKALADEKNLAAMGEKAHRNVRKRFSWEMMEKRLDRFYRLLLG